MHEKPNINALFDAFLYFGIRNRDAETYEDKQTYEDKLYESRQLLYKDLDRLGIAHHFTWPLSFSGELIETDSIPVHRLTPDSRYSC
jgi:hypothetical protein